MTDLFDKDVQTVSEHIGNVYAKGEQEATIRKFQIVHQWVMRGLKEQPVQGCDGRHLAQGEGDA
ncbi:hypothetical protein [Halomonas sp. BM-2019]|uniref:hypothetical protein n=1 Tax=Halomonas sp. BM-2019 TaxID=2811227 RepID=UPI001B3C243A|nr:MAG: hypothetical protein J5F18_15245 [Halomonas sp. BM-2019]